MTGKQIKKLRRESEKMLAKMEEDPKLKQIYKDVNFYRIIENSKEELLSRKTAFRELTPDELKHVENIFA